MKRIVLMVTVALVMAVMAVAPAFATVHPLSKAECSAEPAGDTAGTQDPPGLTPGGPDHSKAEIAQPVQSANSNAFKPEGCSAPQK
jgi:hypothetical protein